MQVVTDMVELESCGDTDLRRYRSVEIQSCGETELFRYSAGDMVS